MVTLVVLIEEELLRRIEASLHPDLTAEEGSTGWVFTWNRRLTSNCFHRIFQIRKQHLQCQPQWMRTRVRCLQLSMADSEKWIYKSELNIPHETRIFHRGASEQGEWGVDLKENTEILHQKCCQWMAIIEEIFVKVMQHVNIILHIKVVSFILHTIFFDQSSIFW